MTNSSENVSVGFISLGCAKNLVDSQVMIGELLADGVRFVPDPEDADIVVVNTCAFIEDAREESVETILSACELKKSGNCKAVLVAGCLSQRYREKLIDALPDVDAFIGLDELDRVAEVAREIMGGAHGIVEVSEGSADRVYEPEYPELVLTGAPFAYLKVSEGCNHKCAFCAIPDIRGSRRSRTVESVLGEAAALLDSGIRELDLISQDITAYGKDLDSSTGLVTLLKEMSQLGDDFWIRLLYGYPSGLSRELLELVASTPNICSYFDIPIQHSHPDILRAMRRADTADNLAQSIEQIREIVPGVAIRTTCLVGFPGEEEEHFNHLMDFIKWARFDHLGVFVYSPEEGTPAFDMPGRPEIDIAEERLHLLMTAQQEIVREKGDKLVGESDMILIESAHPEDSGVMIGRSERLAPEVDGDVFVEGAAEEDIGQFVNVKYIERVDYDMLAEKAGS